MAPQTRYSNNITTPKKWYQVEHLAVTTATSNSTKKRVRKTKARARKTSIKLNMRYKGPPKVMLNMRYKNPPRLVLRVPEQDPEGKMKGEDEETKSEDGPPSPRGVLTTTITNTSSTTETTTTTTTTTSTTTSTTTRSAASTVTAAAAASNATDSIVAAYVNAQWPNVLRSIGEGNSVDSQGMRYLRKTLAWEERRFQWRGFRP